jgi:anti-sigma28 factor (negative regulator of flagellin synthesis)
VDFAKRYKEIEEDCKSYQQQLESYEFLNFFQQEKIEKLKKEIENFKKEKS